jgi:hypothetical protein
MGLSWYRDELIGINSSFEYDLVILRSCLDLSIAAGTHERSPTLIKDKTEPKIMPNNKIKTVAAIKTLNFKFRRFTHQD